MCYVVKDYLMKGIRSETECRGWYSPKADKIYTSDLAAGLFNLYNLFVFETMYLFKHLFCCLMRINLGCLEMSRLLSLIKV